MVRIERRLSLGSWRRAAPGEYVVRFLFALRALREAFRERGVSPYGILIAAESSDDARKAGVLPTPVALESAVALVHGMGEHLGRTWQWQMARHFAAIFSVLTNTLTRRYEVGLAFGAGALQRPYFK
jgi:hypothetical protein